MRNAWPRCASRGPANAPSHTAGRAQAYVTSVGTHTGPHRYWSDHSHFEHPFPSITIASVITTEAPPMRAPNAAALRGASARSGRTARFGAAGTDGAQA